MYELYRTHRALGERLFVVYALMALGTLASLYSAVLIRKPDTSGLAAIVFLCVVISFPDIEDGGLERGGRPAPRQGKWGQMKKNPL